MCSFDICSLGELVITGLTGLFNRCFFIFLVSSTYRKILYLIFKENLNSHTPEPRFWSRSTPLAVLKQEALFIDQRLSSLFVKRFISSLSIWNIILYQI